MNHIAARFLYPHWVRMLPTRCARQETVAISYPPTRVAYTAQSTHLISPPRVTSGGALEFRRLNREFLVPVVSGVVLGPRPKLRP